MNISQNNKRIKLKVVGSHDESFFFFKKEIKKKRKRRRKKTKARKTQGGKTGIKKIYI